MGNVIKLSERLSVIASFINEGASVADVGTDHGFLPVYLAQSGMAKRIIASDISAGSLGAARRSAEKYGVTDKITFVTAPGLTGIGADDADTIVIAGMGGGTIAGILYDAPWTGNRDVRLILQPQTKVKELCEWLRESGYIIRGAKLTRDNGRYYIVMLVKGGQSDSSLDPEIELLARLMHSGDPLFSGYMDELIERTQQAMEGMRKAAEPELLSTALSMSVYIGLKEAFRASYQ